MLRYPLGEVAGYTHIQRSAIAVGEQIHARRLHQGIHPKLDCGVRRNDKTYFSGICPFRADTFAAADARRFLSRQFVRPGALPPGLEADVFERDGRGGQRGDFRDIISGCYLDDVHADKMQPTKSAKNGLRLPGR